MPGAVFSGSVDGHLRAFASEDGRVLWDADTAREFTGVNGAQGNGGSIDGPGAVIVNGMVYINSGYARQGGMPGNVLLAFAP
jgi:polyvinyl alcohol dehydrogenase (cytochrome)